MGKKRSLKTQKNYTWAACSKYVRHRGSKDGRNICFTCGVSSPVSELQAGHAIQGRGNSILFETDAIRPQCAGCNVFQGGRLDVFIPRLLDEIGRQRYDELLALKGKHRKFTVDELKQLEDEYKEKLNESQ